jgi:hypothetical protein
MSRFARAAKERLAELAPTSRGPAPTGTPAYKDVGARFALTTEELQWIGQAATPEELVDRVIETAQKSVTGQGGVAFGASMSGSGHVTELAAPADPSEKSARSS